MRLIPVVKNLSLAILIGTSYIDLFITNINPMEHMIVFVPSTTAAIMSAYTLSVNWITNIFIAENKLHLLDLVAVNFGWKTTRHSTEQRYSGTQGQFASRSTLCVAASERICRAFNAVSTKKGWYRPLQLILHIDLQLLDQNRWVFLGICSWQSDLSYWKWLFIHEQATTSAELKTSVCSTSERNGKQNAK